MSFHFAAALIVLCGLPPLAAFAQSSDCGRSAIEHELDIRPPNEEPAAHLSLTDAMDFLTVPSASIAVVDDDELRLVCAFGHGTPPAILYQAASLSKIVTAVTALRLVDRGRLGLDDDVNTTLRAWQVPKSALSNGHPVTLRGLLSMTGGIGVPGFSGYEPG